ncbi:MAG: ADP-ribosylglycohydrolase family protein [Candidatus Omnitrophota bacterium]
MRGKAVALFSICLTVSLISCGAGKQIKEKLSSLFQDEKKAPATHRLSFTIYEEKLRGAWAGKMIGASYGDPYDHQFQGQIMENPIRPWNAEYAAAALGHEDLCAGMTFLEALDAKGLFVTSREAAEYFARTKYSLDGANDAARKNVRADIYPPQSGQPRYNPYANDGDFQSEADLFGLLCPGMPFTASKLAAPFGEIMSSGDGFCGGLFTASLYAAAYFEDSRSEIVMQALKSIPAQSDYARLIGEVLEAYKKDPTDWRSCWKMLEEKWGKSGVGPAGDEKAANADAKLNGGYIVTALLYGDADFAKTLEITVRCGRRCGSNAAIAAGVLGTILGYDSIPREYRTGVALITDKNFASTPYHFNTLIESCRKWTTDIVRRRGGSLETLGDRQYLTIPIQKPALIGQYEPFTAKMANDLQEEWKNLDAVRLSGLQRKLLAEIPAFAKGWTIANCGTNSYAGALKEYRGRYGVFATNPLSQETPCRLTWKGVIPAGKPALRFAAAADASWTLRVLVNGEELANKVISNSGGVVEWQTQEFDLSPYAGKNAAITLENGSNGGSDESAYWNRIEINAE